MILLCAAGTVRCTRSGSRSKRVAAVSAQKVPYNAELNRTVLFQDVFGEARQYLQVLPTLDPASNEVLRGALPSRWWAHRPGRSEVSAAIKRRPRSQP
jgi:hypothetical protein